MYTVQLTIRNEEFRMYITHKARCEYQADEK